MAKRKQAPKAKYTYVADETAPVGSEKRGKTGGIKKEKTSGGSSGLRRPSSLSAGRPRKPIEGFYDSASATVSASAESAGEAFNLAELQKQKAHAEFVKKQTAEVSSNIPLADRPAVVRHSKKDRAKQASSRKAELEAQLTEAPFSKAEPAQGKMGPLIPVRADVAAGPTGVPARGTKASSAPAKPDRGDETAGLVEVKKKAGRGRQFGSIGAPDAITAAGGNPEMREARSEGSIKETKGLAKSRVQGGLRTTQYTPNTIAERSTARENRNKRLQIKMRKRAEKGKTKLPGQVLSSAAAAESMATETAAAKAKVETSAVSGRDAGKFVYSHEALAQDLARTHFPAHSASDIMDYAKSTGSDMVAFHTHVRQSAKAHEMIDVGPEGDKRKRSAGKITRWTKDPSTGEYKATSGYEGWHTVKKRGGEGGMENVKAWKKFEAPKGGLSHIEYLNAQIEKFKQNRSIQEKSDRDLNRTRRRHRATAALVDAMAPGTGVPEKKPTKTRIPKGTSGQYVSQKPGEEPVIQKPKKPGFTEVKSPRSKRA